MVRWGHQVTWFASTYPGAPAQDEIKGVRIMRAGGQATVHLHACAWYRRHGAGQFDAVADEINTIPFYAHRYARCCTVAFVMQLAREVWWYEAPLLLALLGYALEPLYLRPYRQSPIVTISQSSADSLRALGLRGPVTVIPMATDFEAEPVLPPLADKEPQRTLVSLGRVVPSKRVSHAIRALAQVRVSGPPVGLWVIGPVTSRYQRQLEGLAADLGVGGRVRFWGRVTETQKRHLLRRAHLLVACSVREGWGLMVTEAGSVGTPAVVYNVPGLRDSTHDGKTGLVCEPASPERLAAVLDGLLADPEEYARLRRGAWQQARALNWDRTALDFLAALEGALASQPP